MLNKIIVNGVDGSFGSVVAEKIMELVPKESLVFTAPQKDKLQKYADLGIEVAEANFNHPDELAEIFKNADKVLLISMPFVGPKRRAAHKNCIDACIKGNVKQIIYTSIMDASNTMNPSVEQKDHSFTESYIQRNDLDYIFLRNSQYAEAMVSAYDQAIRETNSVLSNNMGQGKMAFISRKDCALAATHALINQRLHREVLNINGLELLTIEEFIQIGNEATGNNVKYNELTSEEVYQFFDAMGVPRTTDGEIAKDTAYQYSSDGMVTFGDAIREGFFSIKTNDFVELTGHKPISVRHMFENIDDFQIGNRVSTDE